MENPAPPAPPPPPPAARLEAETSLPAGPQALAPATGYEKAAWIFVGLSLLFVLDNHLLPALLAGLLVHVLVGEIATRIEGKSLSHHRAKLVAISVLGSLIVVAVAAVVLLLLAFLKGRLGGLPELLHKMASILESLRERLGGAAWIPAADGLKEALAKGLREHARELEHAGGEAGHVLIHALVGIVIGALLSFEFRRPDRPLSKAILRQVELFSEAFHKVVFAQVRISGLNAGLTALFLLVALPLFGVELPLRKTLVLITFLVGLIPVVGNLISNSAIVIIAMGTSLPAAVACLAFLVVVHKLEYFLNAKIVGHQIHASAWEILLAMVCLEAAFGLAGVILAPIVYAYAKKELAGRGLI